MKLKYVGKDRLGVTIGEIYDVKIQTKGDYIIVSPTDICEDWSIPYRSPEMLSKSWVGLRKRSRQ